MKKVLFLAASFLAGNVLADATIFQQVGQINFDGDSNITYFSGPAKWGSPSCANASMVEVKGTVPGRKEILSIALAAKMAGKRVQFWGTCATDPNYFTAFYIVVE